MSTRTHRTRSTRSNTSSISSRSYTSDHSRSTAPTVHSERPVYKHHDTSPVYLENHVAEPLDYEEHDSRTSIDTYASTAASAEDLTPQPQYEVPRERMTTFASDSISTIPSEFAELFGPNRRILIEHDDSTSDGNMNLRLDTEITVSGGRRKKMTLFHLRMQNLRDRNFSFRRYCRESGREVCKSSRKCVVKPSVPEPKRNTLRPKLQRSFSTAISALIGSKAHGTARPPLERAQTFSHGFDGHEASDSGSDFVLHDDLEATVPTNTIRLEFSNYAQVQIHPEGSRSSKRYEFEYWGHYFHWAREVCQDGEFSETSYHLINATSNRTIAHITPEQLTRRQARKETHQGGWVPPCSLTITDEDAFLTDLPDVIVATGLMALVDDCIKRHWHSKSGVSLRAPDKKTADHITPKGLLKEMFNR